jgi:hypothetical protein
MRPILNTIHPCSQVWLDPATRVDATIDAFIDAAADSGDLVQEMNVCDLDSTLSELCRQIQNARGAVFEANCQAAGVCMDEVFYYQPSMFSLSNNQFARQTVEEFYRFIEPTACLAQRSARNAELASQNGELVKKCPVQVLIKFEDILNTARVQAGSFVRAAYFLLMILLHAVRLSPLGGLILGASEYDDALANMRIYLDLMMQELGNALSAMLDLLMSTLLGTDIGSWMQELVTAVCELSNWMLETFYIGAFCPVKEAIEGVLTEIINILSPLGMNLSGLKSFRDSMVSMSCDPENVLADCAYVDIAGRTPIARVDAATRCWSTYVNSLGDASSLSCSASDSCLQYDPSNPLARDGLVACDDCPLQLFSDFQRYGCDIVRKQCKCSVQTISRSACINHAQCQSEDAVCDILNTPLDLSAFGTTPCATCTQGTAMCIDAPGGARCACPSNNDGLQTCEASDKTKSIMPDPTGLCLVTLGASTVGDAASSVEYALQYGELAAAPCAMLSQTFCFSVYSSSWAFSTFVVGISRLPVASRRLLETEQIQAREALVTGMIHISEYDLERVAMLPWEAAVDDGCRLVGPLGSLVMETNLSVSDQVLYRQCVRWRAIGDDVRRAFNLTVPDTFLLSMRDLAAALSDPAVVIGIVTHPEMFIYTALHSEMAAPVRATLRSLRVWAAHSMSFLLDHSRWLRAEYDSRNVTTANGTSDGEFPDTFRRLHTSHSLRLELMRAAPMPPVHTEPSDQSYTEETFTENNPTEPPTTEPPTTELMDEFDELPPALPDTNDPVFVEVVPDDVFFNEEDPASPNRRLLDFQDTMDSVKAYSTHLALGDGASLLMGGSISDAFEDGPLEFPGVFTHYATNLQCAPAVNTAVLIMESFKLVGVYFSTAAQQFRPAVARNLGSSMPSFNPVYRDGKKSQTEPPQGSIAGIIGRYIFQDVAGLDADFVRDVLHAVPDILYRFTRCDIDSVMLCTEFRYSLLSGSIVVAVLLYLVSIVVASLGVPYTWTVAAVLYLPIVLFYSLGYSPFCAPLIPTCLGEEIIRTFDTLLPQHIWWPNALQQSIGCMENSNISASDCVVSCNAHPFNFHGWVEPFAWSVCELNADACSTVYKWLRSQSFANAPGTILYDVSAVFWRSHTVITQADPDTVMAYRICAIFTSWRTVPVIFAVVVFVYTVPIIIMTPFQILLAGMQMTIAAISMSHMHLRESIRGT